MPSGWKGSLQRRKWFRHRVGIKLWVFMVLQLLSSITVGWWLEWRYQPLCSLFMSVVYSKKSLNETFVSLIPKKGGDSDLNDFRPLSLQDVYRILAKILANILKDVLGKVISQLYNAIVQERQILGSVLIANKCMSGSPKILFNFFFKIHLTLT